MDLYYILLHNGLYIYIVISFVHNIQYKEKYIIGLLSMSRTQICYQIQGLESLRQFIRAEQRITLLDASVVDLERRLEISEESYRDLQFIYCSASIFPFISYMFFWTFGSIWFPLEPCFRF